MSFERYQKICNNLDTYIKPDKSVSYTFDGTELLNAERLFFTGETGISYIWKTEPDYQMLYRRIDDSLDTIHAETQRYCLNFSGDFCSYPKVAYKKLVAPLHLSYIELTNCSKNWKFGIAVKSDNLIIKGYLRMMVEIRLRHDGIDPHSTVEEPDNTFVINIPEGTYSLKSLFQDICFDVKQVGSICIYVEGENYSGSVFFEAPFLTPEQGSNILPPFAPHTADRDQFNWMGQNLSHIEWPALKIDLNDTCIFDGKFFERCHRFSEVEIALPKRTIRKGENTLTFTCKSDFHDAPGYQIGEIGFISLQDTKIISIPENIVAGKPFCIFVNGKKDERLSFSSDMVVAIGELILSKDGLNVLEFICHKPSNNITLTLDNELCTILRCVEKMEDGVLTGTGDLVYIGANKTDIQNYLKWYLSNHIGNMLTIRPTYRWNGTRTLDNELWHETAEFLDQGNIQYVHMIDGRELPGCNANPLPQTLASKSFLGRQTHEFDGQFCYWGMRDFTNDSASEMFYDLFLRMFKEHGQTMNVRYVPENMYYETNSRTVFRKVSVPHDMQIAAETFIENLKKTRYQINRHTGPATLFKYFYQAGYDWVGAELMYNPTEITVASLRGARSVYGGKTGAHLAVQWATVPHDTEYRYRRYRLALFISYIQGIEEINTEEGLWRLEEGYSYHHRFSLACKNHLVQQQDFYRFVSTHTRTGVFYTPIAFVSGRYDGWRCFVRGGDTWGVPGFGFTDVEKSWDILTFFYPKSKLDALYYRNGNSTNKPQGYYSGTPYGNVDIVPIEAQDFSNYRLLVVPGYNKALPEDMDKFQDYVNNGGTLIIGWPQLSVSTRRNEVVSCEHSYADYLPLPKNPRFVLDFFEGKPVHVCDNLNLGDTFLYTDTGRPLVVKYQEGTGTVWFVNAKEYAGNEAIAAVYGRIFETAVPNCLSEERVYAKADSNVQFTVYDNEDGSRNIYFIATDWHKEDAQGKGIITIGENSYTVAVPFGSVVKVAISGDCAIYPTNDQDEVLSIRGNKARVQGVGCSEFVVLQGGVKRVLCVNFGETNVKEIIIF